jgi:uncharacterized protein (DUF427 family)
VWAFPRPAQAELCSRHIRIVHRGVVLADTRRSVRTLETSHPPSYYIPPGDIDMHLLSSTGRRSVCEWKGEAGYVDALIGGQILRNVGWFYPDPTPAFAILRDHVAFYAAPFDACTVDNEQVVPQEGPFYGGWITSHVAGPFKGAPGTSFW